MPRFISTLEGKINALKLVEIARRVGREYQGEWEWGLSGVADFGSSSSRANAQCGQGGDGQQGVGGARALGRGKM
jgi:hypothetical protein